MFMISPTIGGNAKRDEGDVVASSTAAGGPLRVELLGSVRAWRGDDEVKLGSARKRALFAALALRANQVVSREELLDGLWGEYPPTSAEGILYTYVSELRRALEPDRSKWSVSEVLTSMGAGYCLTLEPARLDLHRCEQLREAAQAEWASGRTYEAISFLDEALGLWHGGALAGLTGPLADLQRVRLNELRLTTLERRAELLIATGAAADTVAELSGLVAGNPLREGLRGLLMQALHASGRQAEALEVFRDTRALLIAELGIEPSSALRRLHELILANNNISTGVVRTPPAVPPAPARERDWQPATPAQFVGRHGELGLIHEAVQQVMTGRGGALWVEGEPGIGKSALVAAALHDLPDGGIQVAWGACDEIGQRFPLGALLDALGVSAESNDPRRAEVAKALREDVPRPGVWYASDPVMAAVDRVLALVDVLCAETPMVIVLDDMQLADDVSMLAWRRLTRVARQSSLLLIAVCRPVPFREEVDRLREDVEAVGGTVLSLGPLPDTAVRELLEMLLDARPGPHLRRLASRAAGNPLYFRQVVDTLLREDAVRERDGVADIYDITLHEVPSTIASVIWRKLNFLDTETREVLRWAAMLGIDFAPGELSVVTGRSASDLTPALVHALAAGVLVETGYRFAFRHPLIRHSLYESLPAALRVAWHRQAAEALASSGSSVERVVEQLLAAPAGPDVWVAQWLLKNTEAIAKRSPAAAIDLLKSAVDSDGVQADIREALTARLARLLFWLGRDPQKEARNVLAITSNSARAAEMRWLLAYGDYRNGDVEQAVHSIVECVNDASVPELWRARHEALLAMVQRAGQGDPVAAEMTASSALRRATDVGDVFATAYSLEVLWQVESVRRNHRAALDYVDRSLEAVTAEPELADLHLSLLDNRIFTLQNLDRLDEASRTLDLAQEMVTHRSSPGGMHITAAIHHYWLGRWDDALVEIAAADEDGLERTFFGTRERSPVLQQYGASALIAGRRGVVADMVAALEDAEEHESATVANRESSDFLLAAKALAAEQRGSAVEALAIFMPILDPDYAQMMLRHQWLPTVIRLALDTSDRDAALQALSVCEKEATMELTPARAWCAAAWCRGLVANDPSPLLEAAEHYRKSGRRVELANVLEDAAVLLARGGSIAGAEQAFREARTVYTQLRAAWDISRGEARLHEFGVRRVIPSAEERADVDSILSATELAVAELVAAGCANPDIAAQLSVSRLAVQAHVARIMDKLGVDSRGGIAHWMLTRPR